MGPQPPLKRRPTYTPYTRPYQTRRIRETDLHRCKKPSYHPPCGSIYIYACMYVYARRYRGHESIPHCHEPRHISTITDSFPPCVPCPPKFAPVFPGYFPFPTFPPFRYPTPRSASSPLPFAYIRGRPMKPFEKDSSPDRPYSLFFRLSLCVHSRFPFDSRKERIRGIDVFESGSWKRYEHLYWIFFLPATGYTSHDIYFYERGRWIDLLSRLLAIRHYVGQMFDEVRFV